MSLTDDPLTDLGLGGELTPADIIAAGRLLALARSSSVAIDSIAVKEAANVTAERGILYALGWVNGWWWHAGNSDPRNNRTWRAMRNILGEPVR